MKKLDKKIVITASILGAITVAIGAFGAHGLKQLVDAEAIGSFETGVRYQMYHVIALLVIGLARPFSNHAHSDALEAFQNTKKWVFRFFSFGILLFSGSIYILALKEILPFNVNFLGPVTPLGGLLFMMGWLRLCYGLFKVKS